MYEKIKKQLLPILFEQKKDFTPKLIKTDSKDQAKDKALEKLLPVQEILDKEIQKILGECSAYFQRIVGMGMAKPMHSIINIFSPNITQNITIDSNNTNTIDSNNSPDYSTNISNCGNSSYSYRLDTKIKVKTNISLTESHKSESHTNIGRIDNEFNYGKLNLNGKSPLFLKD